MILTNLYAFYGSLRRGQHNYDRFESHLQYRFSAWIRGYQLYSFGDFPFAVKTNQQAHRILVEIFAISEMEVEREIDELELGYGYYQELIQIDQLQVRLYLFKDQANYPLVLGGDWVKFYRS